MTYLSFFDHTDNLSPCKSVDHNWDVWREGKGRMPPSVVMFCKSHSLIISRSNAFLRESGYIISWLYITIHFVLCCHESIRLVVYFSLVYSDCPRVVNFTYTAHFLYEITIICDFFLHTYFVFIFVWKQKLSKTAN